jgi:hypothetical protein
MSLVLEDPGGEPLADEEITARLIDRGLQQGLRRRKVSIVGVSGRLRGGGMAIPLEVATGNHVQR